MSRIFQCLPNPSLLLVSLGSFSPELGRRRRGTDHLRTRSRRPRFPNGEKAKPLWSQFFVGLSGERTVLSTTLAVSWNLGHPAFRQAATKSPQSTVSVAKRDEGESVFAAWRTKYGRLTAHLACAETKINDHAGRLFGLLQTDVRLAEGHACHAMTTPTGRSEVAAKLFPLRLCRNGLTALFGGLRYRNPIRKHGVSSLFPDGYVFFESGFRIGKEMQMGEHYTAPTVRELKEAFGAERMGRVIKIEPRKCQDAQKFIASLEKAYRDTKKTKIQFG